MFRKYLRILNKNRVSALISIGGFSLSIAVVLLLLAFIHAEKQYDSSLPDLDQIYRVISSDRSASIPELAGDKLSELFPNIIAASKVNISSEPVIWEDETFNLRVIHTDSGFFKVFSLSVISGKSEGLFQDPHYAVLTESGAKKIFGDTDPIGQVMELSHREDVQVVAVVEDLPEKSSISGNMFCSADLRIRYSRSGYNESYVYLYNLYLKLNARGDHRLLEEELTRVIHPLMDWREVDYLLQPYSQVYFDITTLYDNHAHANVKMIRLLGWLSLVILCLAVFNYINLTVAQSTGRLHELGVKQVFGAERIHLIRLFLREAFLQLIAALILAVVLALLLNPVISDILGKKIELFSIAGDPGTVLLIVSGLALITLFSGIYPAVSILQLKPAQMLMNRAPTIGKQFNIRRILILIQFTAMVTLIISLITLHRQVNYVQDKDLGYSTELLLRVPVHYKIKDRVPAMLEELSKLAIVKELCASHGTPGAIWSSSSDDGLHASHISSDYRFIRTFQLDILHGRNFHEGELANVCLVNETFMRNEGGWDSIQNTRLFGSTIVGVIEDFHFKDLYSSIGNLQIRNEPDVSHLCIRLYPGDLASALNQIEEVFSIEAQGFAFSFEFYDEWMEAKYRQEEKRAHSIRLLSIIAIMLSCMGLFGMADYITRSRRNEIGIRKVNGAGIARIIWLLNMDLLKWIIPGLIAGIPLGWYFMNKWLQGFAYKTSLDWWIFVLSVILSLLVAILTVSWQTWRAARMNPIDAIRHE